MKKWKWRGNICLLLLLALCLGACDGGEPAAEEAVAGETAETTGESSTGSPGAQSASVSGGGEGGRAPGLFIFRGEEMREEACGVEVYDHEDGDGYMEDGELIEPHTHLMAVEIYTLLTEGGQTLAQVDYTGNMELLNREYALVYGEAEEGMARLLDRRGETLLEGLTMARHVGGGEAADIFCVEDGAGNVSLVKVERNQLGSATVFDFDGRSDAVYGESEDFYAHLDGEGKLQLFDIEELLAATGEARPFWEAQNVSYHQWGGREDMGENGYRYISLYEDDGGQHLLTLTRNNDAGGTVEVTVTDVAGQALVGSDGWVAVQQPREEGALWGYVDSGGEEVISPTYAEARPFYGGVAVVGIDRPDQLDQTKFTYFDPAERYYTAINHQGEDIARLNGGVGMEFDQLNSYGGFLVGEVENSKYIVTHGGELRQLDLTEEQRTVDGKVCEMAGFLPQYTSNTTVCPVTLALREDLSAYYPGLYDVEASAWVQPPTEEARYVFYNKEFLLNDMGEGLVGSLEEDVYLCWEGESLRFFDAEGVEIAADDPRLANLAIKAETETERGLRWADGSWLYKTEKGAE